MIPIQCTRIILKGLPLGWVGCIRETLKRGDTRLGPALILECNNFVSKLKSVVCEFIFLKSQIKMNKTTRCAFHSFRKFADVRSIMTPVNVHWMSESDSNSNPLNDFDRIVLISATTSSPTMNSWARATFRLSWRHELHIPTAFSDFVWMERKFAHLYPSAKRTINCIFFSDVVRIQGE